MENPSSLVAIEELGDEESKSSDHDNGMEIREITSGSKDMGDAVAMVNYQYLFLLHQLLLV